MNAIEVKNLTKKFTGFTLNNISFNLPSGCIMGLIGENGAGKSTTIKLLLNSIRRDKGSVKLLGEENNASSLIKDDIGVVLDDIGFPEILTAHEVNNIMKNIYNNWDENKYYGFLKDFSIPKDKKFKDFSRGTKMKLGIATALSHNPRLLILDEATSGLDPVIRDELLDIFLEFTRDERHSILISSHFVSDLEKICDYILFLHNGKILLCEEKDRLYEKYGIIQCEKEKIDRLGPDTIIGKRESKYGVKAIVQKEKIPAGIKINPIDLEELFVFMVKEAE